MRPNELVPGNCYFLVNFYDTRMPCRACRPFSTSAARRLSRPALRTVFLELPPEIARLLGSKEQASVTITIKYTDDGFSLTTKGDRLEWSCQWDVKTESRRETIFRQHFGKARPTRDYLFNLRHRHALRAHFQRSLRNARRRSVPLPLKQP